MISGDERKFKIRLVLKNPKAVYIAKSIVGSFLSVQDEASPYVPWMGFPYGEVLAGNKIIPEGMISPELVGEIKFPSDNGITNTDYLNAAFDGIESELARIFGPENAVFEWMQYR